MGPPSSMIAAAISVKSGLFEPFENVVTRLLYAKLCCETPAVEEWREMRDDDALALGILTSSHLGVRGRKKRMRCSLDAASGAAGEGTITGLDCFAVAVEKIVGDT